MESLFLFPVLKLDKYLYLKKSKKNRRERRLRIDIQFSYIFCHCLFEFYSHFNFRYSRKSLYIRLEECSCCAVKGDAVYTSIRIEESLIIDSYLKSRQLKRVEILADGFCIISGWLTCLEALDLTKACDDLIEEAREHMLADANLIYIKIKLIMI